MRWSASRLTCVAGTAAAVLIVAAAHAAAQAASGWDATDRAIAARFAPIFHQGMVGTRYDYITSFDFDGDWVGDNNWTNAADPTHPQRAHVYYAVSETPTHYFVHYAAFHPRDYKGGELTGALLSQAVRRGAQASARVRPTAIANDVVLAHENDLEGCLVVAEKKGPRLEDAVVVVVETLAHNQYLKYQRQATLSGSVGSVRFEGEHPLVYIEPKGHGIEAFADQLTAADGRSAVGTGSGGNAPPEPPGGRTGLAERVAGLVSRVETARKLVNMEQPETIRVYRYTGVADDPEKAEGDIGYDLLPLYHTIWARAQRVPNETFGEVQDYGTREARGAPAGSAPRPVQLGSLGSSFRGVQGAENKARPPWGWFDMAERERPLGEWFFDPAAAVARHFPALGIDTSYLHQPFYGIVRTL